MTAPQTAGTGGVQGEAAATRPGPQPITSFIFEPAPTQGEVRARLTALEAAKHATHDEPRWFCLLCPPVRLISPRPETVR